MLAVSKWDSVDAQLMTTLHSIWISRRVLCLPRELVFCVVGAILCFPLRSLNFSVFYYRELMYALSTKLDLSSESYHLACPPWWDRSCDLGLLMGTFFHGLGNYEAMKNDEELPFASKIKSYVKCNSSEAESYRHFEVAADAAKQVFDTALVTMKKKFREQTHAAVAAVFAATKNSGEGKSNYHAKAQEMNDDDIVSVARLNSATLKAFREPIGRTSKGEKTSSVNKSLPLPDSKHLDYLLVKIVENIESNPCSSEQSNSIQEKLKAAKKDSSVQEGGASDDAISTNKEILQEAKKSRKFVRKDTGVLFAGSRTVGEKKPQQDRSDYFLGAASADLAGISVGADSSRYQRGPFVPLGKCIYYL